jgi:ketosteroid isomerase-like protein
MLLHVNRVIIVIIAGVIIAGFVLAPVKMFGAAGNPKLSTGPTAENALAADQELARALRDNDTVGILRMLDKDWVVITTHGGLAEGPDVFPSGIRTGYLTRKSYEISEPRVRLYGNVALVTTKVRISGTFKGKSFDVKERQTDVLRWEDGKWTCILTHESNLEE